MQNRGDSTPLQTRASGSGQPFCTIDKGELWILRLAALQWVREHSENPNADAVRRAADIADNLIYPPTEGTLEA